MGPSRLALVQLKKCELATYIYSMPRCPFGGKGGSLREKPVSTAKEEKEVLFSRDICGHASKTIISKGVRSSCLNPHPFHMRISAF